MANAKTYGEKLFEEYLVAAGISFECEPPIPGISQLFDFVIDHPTAGKVLIDVKDINNSPVVKGFSQVNSYQSIHAQIDDGRKKFKAVKDHICALVIVVAPGNFAMLEEPHIMLGAMYGDYGFKIPFNTETGVADPERITTEFQFGKGKMIQSYGIRHTRIAALITVQQYHLWNLAMRKYVNTDDGRPREERFQDVFAGNAGLPEEGSTELGVTIWENATAPKKLPPDLFRGQMDAWWEANSDGRQALTFIGERRRNLGVDDRRR